MSDPGSELTITLKLDTRDATADREAFVRASQSMDAARVVRIAPQALPPDLRRSMDLENRTLMPARLPVGPAQRLQRAQQSFQTAQQQGTPAQVFDAQQAVQTAQKAMDRATKPAGGDSFFSRLETTLLRSRFGSGGGGVMPLGRDLMGLFGRGTMVALAVGAFASVIKEAIEAVSRFASAAREFEQNRFTSGATPQEQAKLDVIGAGLGMSGGDAAQAARRLAQARQTDPNAMRFFGYRPPDIAGAPTDVAGDFMKALMKIRQAPTEEAAIRMARAGGLEEFLGVRNMSPQSLQMMGAAAQMHARSMQGTAQFGSDFGVSAGLLKVLGGDAANAAARNAMVGHSPIMDALRGAARHGVFGPAGGLIAGVSDFNAGVQGGMPGAGGGLMGPGGAGSAAAMDPVVAAMQENTAALKRNSDRLEQQGVFIRDLSRHFHGAGQRARNASPAHLRYQSMNAFLDDSGLQLGQMD